jgi:MFS transporter, FHS family, L-fucose permease
MPVSPLPPPASMGRTPAAGPLAPAGTGLVFCLVTALFFLWGIPNNLNDVLIRQFMKSFEISRFQAGLVQSAFYLGYFLISMPAALFMRRYGYKAGLVAGLLLYSFGTFLFWPAAMAGRYEFFLGALFVIAAGLAFLETGANPFIAQLGSADSAARRLNFAQAFNPIGSMVGVLVGTLFIFSGVELTGAQVEVLRASGEYPGYLRQEILRVVTPYLVLAVIALGWAVVLWRTEFPVLAGEEAGAAGKGGGVGRLLRKPAFLMAVAAQFFYVGAQVGTWSYFIQYVQDYTGQQEKAAGYLLTGTLAAFGLGRFSSSAWMRKIAPQRLMTLYALVNVGLCLVAVLLPGWTGMWCLLLTSFFMSIMFPTIFALGLAGLGELTKIGGSMIVMGIIGGAVITPVMGLLAERGSALAMVVPLLCYVFIAGYAHFVADRA